MGGIGCYPRVVGQEHQKSLPVREASMRLVSILFALTGVLPSLTQMAPDYRELDKYEANNGAQRNRVQHDVTSCKPSRGRSTLSRYYAHSSRNVKSSCANPVEHR